MTDITSRARAVENDAQPVPSITDSCCSDSSETESSLLLALLRIVGIVHYPAYSLTIIKCASEYCGMGSISVSHSTSLEPTLCKHGNHGVFMSFVQKGPNLHAGSFHFSEGVIPSNPCVLGQCSEESACLNVHKV
jgi:hypothetical protein